MTVLSFSYFFWIWWIVVVAGGGASYLQKNTDVTDALRKQVADLTEEIRSLKRGDAAS
jgi:hypothetical protein